jgi:hypothetical protein
MNQATAEATIYSYEDWLAICLPTRNTANTYRSGVLSFLRSVYGTDDKPEILAPRYIAEIKSGQRSYFKDLITYIAASHDLKAPPKTPNSYLAGVTSFLLWCCDIEATKERKMLKSRMGKGAQEARTEKEDLDRAKLSSSQFRSQNRRGLSAEDVRPPARPIPGGDPRSCGDSEDSAPPCDVHEQRGQGSPTRMAKDSGGLSLALRIGSGTSEER